MVDTTLLIDGENFRYKIDSILKENNVKVNRSVQLKINWETLFNSALKGINIERKIYYSAKLHLHENSIEKSKELIDMQRKLKQLLEKNSFEFLIAGNVRQQIIKAENPSGKDKLVFKEKGVDVKIAVDLVLMACDKSCKTVILCSSDSDLQPAIKEARKRGLKIIYLGFESALNKGLSYTTDKTILFRNSEILEAYKK